MARQFREQAAALDEAVRKEEQEDWEKARGLGEPVPYPAETLDTENDQGVDVSDAIRKLTPGRRKAATASIDESFSYLLRGTVADGLKEVAAVKKTWESQLSVARDIADGKADPEGDMEKAWRAAEARSLDRRISLTAAARINCY